MVGTQPSPLSTLWNVVWGPLVQASRSLSLGVLSKIQIGRLEIRDCDGKTHVYGQEECGTKPSAILIVHSETFWVRLAVFADMGFAESYLLSEVSCTAIIQFFKIFILNRAYMANNTLSSIFSSVSTLFRAAKLNTLTNARLHIAAHYDISNSMFSAFLSRDMTYSCAIWSPRSDLASATETLEQAQDRKLARIIKNARIKNGDRVLEIGTGWGSFAIKAARETGCSVTSLTLSKEQKQLAEERIEEAGLSSKIKVLLCDYRNLDVSEEGPFDKIVSIEMLEAVGREFLDTYFGCIDKFLKTDGGIAVFQCITIPESRYEAYSKGDDFMRRYIFPGGHLPSVSQLVTSIKNGSKGTLIVDSIENIGAHYAKTLRLWRETFLSNFDGKIKPALMREHADLTESGIEVFRRKWEYYFTYCEAAFSTNILGDVIITTSREGGMEIIDDVPM